MKRLALTILGLLLVAQVDAAQFTLRIGSAAGGGGGSAAYVAGTGAGSSNAQTVTTSAIDTTGATAIYACTSSIGNLVLNDSKSNGWTEIDVQGTSTEARLWKANGTPIVGSGHTFSVANNGTRYPTIIVAAFSGVTTNGTPVKNTVTGTSLAPGSVTPSNATNILVSCLAAGNNTGTIAIDSGYTIVSSVAYVDAQHMTGSMAYKVQSAATAGNPTWSWANSNDARAIHAALVP